jgi:hypothetical protein
VSKESSRLLAVPVELRYRGPATTLGPVSGRCATWIGAMWLAGCGGSSIPDPREAAHSYAEAAERGDADAIYEMLSESGQRALSRDEVREMVAEEKQELVDQARAITAPGVVVKARATVRFADGERASLDLEDGEFRVTAADALPAGARTPTQALEQLRRVLARRSYAGLVRVLSPTTRAAIENDLRSLVEGLEDPEGLEVEVRGDGAVIQVPGGHEVRLRREGGIWYVEDFD